MIATANAELGAPPMREQFYGSGWAPTILR